MSTSSVYYKPGGAGGGIILENVAALRAYTSYAANTPYALKGYFNANDGGGESLFYWDATSTEADNGGTVFQPTATVGAGRLKRLIDKNYVPAAWFGAIPDYRKVSGVKVDVANSRIFKEVQEVIPIVLPGTVTTIDVDFDVNRVYFNFIPYGDGVNAAFLATYINGKSLYVTVGGVTYFLGVGSDPGGLKYNDGYGAMYCSITDPGNRNGTLRNVPVANLGSFGLVAKPISSEIKVGQTMTILGARLWSAYKTEPIELNVKITAVTDMHATFTNLDAGRGVLYLTTEPNGTDSFIYTESTEAIIKALDFQAKSKLLYVDLGQNGTGILPYASPAYAGLNLTSERYKDIFILQPGNRIEGNFTIEGRTCNQPVFTHIPYGTPGQDIALGFVLPVNPTVGQIYQSNTPQKWVWDGYQWITSPSFGVLPGSPVIDQEFREGLLNEWVYRWNGLYWEWQAYQERLFYKYILFKINPPAGVASSYALKNLKITMPDASEVLSGIVFLRDYDNAVIRHGMKVEVENVVINGTKYNYTLIDTNGGATYTSDLLVRKKVVLESGYLVKNCKFHGAGPAFNVKSVADNLTAQDFGGKYFNVEDNFIDGGNAITRKMIADTVSYTNESGLFYITANIPGFTWWDFNAHSDFQDTVTDTSVYKPKLRVRKAIKANIVSIVPRVDGGLEITLSAPAPAGSTNNRGESVLAYGKSYQQASWYSGESSPSSYGTEITAGNNVLIVHGLERVPAETLAKLIGEEIRYYSGHNDIKVQAIINPKKARVRINEAQQSLVGSNDLDMVVNWGSGVEGVFGHVIYGSQNVNFTVQRNTIKNSKKLIFRCSQQGSLGNSKVKLIDNTVERVTDLLSFPILNNSYDPFYEIEGTADIENCGTIINNSDWFGGGTLKNVAYQGKIPGNIIADNVEFLANHLTGSAEIVSSKGLIYLEGNNFTVKDSDVIVVWNKGNFDIRDSKVWMNFGSASPAQFDAAIDTLKAFITRGEVKDFENPGIAHSLIQTLSDAQVAKWSRAVTYTDVGASPALIPAAETKFKTGWLSFGNAAYLPVVVENAAAIVLGTPISPRLGRRVDFTMGSGYFNSNDGAVILYLDSRFNYYEVQSTVLHVDGIRVAHSWFSNNGDYITAAQMQYKAGIKLTIKNKTAGTVYFGERMKPLTKRPRLANEMLYLTYDGANWIEDYRQLTGTVIPTYPGLTGEFVYNVDSGTPLVLGWSYDGANWVIVIR